MFKVVLLTAMLAMGTSAVAQMVKSSTTASNGILIDKAADDFSGRAEYTAPTIEFTAQSDRVTGDLFIAKIRKSGQLGPLLVQGFFMYTGEWQYFSSAVFKGGDEVSYTRTSGEVGSCRGGCTLTENFSIKLSPAEIAKHSEGGLIPIQIKAAKTSNTAIVNIPVSYINAINEVAK